MSLPRLLAAAASLLLLATVTLHAQFPRTVLIEEFTSVTCKPCTTATVILNHVLESSDGPRVAVIRNQVLFTPPINPYSTAESEGRKTFYGVTGLPFALIDGNTGLNPNAEGEASFRARVGDRLAIESPLQMNVSQTIAGTTGAGIVNITAGPDGLPQGQYKVYVIAVERMIEDSSLKDIQGSNGETILHDVMRKMLNGQEGADFTIDPDATVMVPFTYTLDNDWNPEQMFIVTFVQDAISNEIMQAAFSTRPEAGVRRELAAGTMNLAVAPQPARDHATASFTLDAPDRVSLRVQDMTGTTVRALDTEVLPAGRQTLPFDLAGLPAGVYTCTVAAGERRSVERIVVVR